jgi:uncharacterized membrane protein YraQ (UPF0718 family)
MTVFWRSALIGILGLWTAASSLVLNLAQPVFYVNLITGLLVAVLAAWVMDGAQKGDGAQKEEPARPAKESDHHRPAA